jgi:uroporphyrinogen decarboxylase
MDSTERLTAVFERKIPDRVPIFELVIDSQVIDAIVPGANIYDFVDKMELDAVCVRPDMKLELIEENTWCDEKGQIIKKTATDYKEVVNRVIRNEDDLRKFEFPDPNADYRFETLKETVERFKGRIPVIVFLRDGWAEARDLIGFAESLTNLMDNPKLVQGIIEKAVDYYCLLGQLAAKAGAKIALSGDDIAGINGLFMSPQHFKDIIYPAMKRLYKSWHESGLYIMKHTDGDVEPVLDLLINTGLDCLHPIDPLAGMSLKKVKEKYGDKICLMGNVNCAGNLVFGTPEDVVEEVKQCLEIGMPGGGYILASSNSIPRSVKPENYAAMIEAGKKYGKY